jgi:hypothetical protein
MNDRLLKLIKRFLLENDFNIDGNTIKFLYVEQYEGRDDTIKFGVNIIIPKKNQSYVVEKFRYDIISIVENLWKYLGQPFGYFEEKILINGEEPPDSMYISQQKEKEILDKFNSKLSRITLKKFSDNGLSFNVEYKPSSDYFYRIFDTQVEFYLSLHVRNFTDNGKNIYPKMSTLDKLSAAITEELNDNESYRMMAEETIIEIIEPELKIFDNDLYYVVFFEVTKIDGIETLPHEWGDPLNKSYFTY